ncbi:MAG TPA: MraY family glycosyltransferase [Spirochaetota bacterium]|nr:MraY family glycosyltransferase [Spirochaetota bacterium]
MSPLLWHKLQLFAASFAVSVVAVPLIMKLSETFGLYDRIDERKIHKNKISRLGGLGIFLGFIMPFLYTVFSVANPGFNVPLYLGALAVIFLTGFFDDISHVRARYKLILQIVAGVLVWAAGLSFNKFNFLNLFEINFGYFSVVITVFWVVAFVNAINLLDGMDGLASGIVFIANIFVFYIAFTTGNALVASMSMVMAGSILGFYIFNFPPAKIFMGDGGAYFLGFIYATMPLMGVKKSSVATIFLIPLILLLVPMLDIVQVVLKRVKMGYNIFIADKNHLHHRLLGIGLSIRGVLVVVYGYTVMLGLTSVLMVRIDPHHSLLLFVIIGLLMFLSLYLLNSAERIIERRDGSD